MKERLLRFLGKRPVFTFQCQAAHGQRRQGVVGIEFSRHPHADAAGKEPLHVKLDPDKFMVGCIVEISSRKIRISLQRVSKKAAGGILYDFLIMVCHAVYKAGAAGRKEP